jgi:hypothetical protein
MNLDVFRSSDLPAVAMKWVQCPESWLQAVNDRSLCMGNPGRSNLR